MSLQKQFNKAKNTCKITFCLPKEMLKDAKEVMVLGEFNNWDYSKGLPMKAKNGEFLATTELDAGKEYQFRYFIDKAIWGNDLEADKYVPTPYGVMNSVVTVFDEQ